MQAVTVFTDAAKLDALRAYLRGCVLHLWQNEKKPKSSDALSSFKECAFPGYATIKLSDEWLFSSGVLYYQQQTFALTKDVDPPVFVAGWYISKNDVLVLAGSDEEGPRALRVTGSKIKVTPKVKIK